MSKHFSCLDGVSFTLHEHFRNIRQIPRPPELDHIYNISFIQSLNYDAIDEEIFIGKCRAKREVLQKQQEIVSEQKLKQQQQQFQQQQRQQEQNFQIQSQETHSHKFQQNLQTTNNFNIMRAENYVTLPLTAITTNPQNSWTPSYYTNTVQHSSNLNSSLTNQILIPAPVNKPELGSNNNIFNKMKGNQQQIQNLKIDLKDFESEQDPFENLSLKVINDIEELDKIFYGTQQISTNNTTNTSSSATTISTTTTTQSSSFISNPTLINNPNSNYNSQSTSHPALYNSPSPQYFNVRNVHNNATYRYNYPTTATTVTTSTMNTFPIMFNDSLKNNSNQILHSQPQQMLGNNDNIDNNLSNFINNDWNFNNSNQFYATDTTKSISNNNNSYVNNYTSKNFTDDSIKDNFYYKKYNTNKNILPSSPTSSTTLRQARSTSDLTKLHGNKNGNDNINDDKAIENLGKEIINGYPVYGNASMNYSISGKVKPYVYGRFTPPPVKTSQKVPFTESHHSKQADHPQFTNYPKQHEHLILKLTKMGFSEDNILRAVDEYGSDELKIINHLCMLGNLTSQGHSAKVVQDVLFIRPESTVAQVESYLKMFKNFQSMGFPPGKIHEALKISETDHDMILDILTSTS